MGNDLRVQILLQPEVTTLFTHDDWQNLMSTQQYVSYIGIDALCCFCQELTIASMWVRIETR